LPNSIGRIMHIPRLVERMKEQDFKLVNWKTEHADVGSASTDNFSSSIAIDHINSGKTHVFLLKMKPFTICRYRVYIIIMHGRWKHAKTWLDVRL
jgi:hypothetical protein